MKTIVCGYTRNLHYERQADYFLSTNKLMKEQVIP